MSFTSPSDDIAIQEGTFAFSYQASGEIKRGQGVEPIGTMQVRAIPAGTTIGKCIGVAANDKSDGDMIAVYGPGNIVRVIVSGSSKCTVGVPMYCTAEGKFTSGDSSYLVSGIKAFPLETQSTANGTARVLLV